MAEVLYDDGGLLLDQEGVAIRRYYFPWAGAKHLPYAVIRHALARPMSWLTGKGRAWGTTTFRHWFPLDLQRWHKSTLSVFDVGGRGKPCVKVLMIRSG